MKTVAVTCSKCAAPLEVPENTRYLTCKFCSSRLELQQSGGAVFTEVLESISEQVGQLTQDVGVIRLQNDLEELDRSFDRTREQFLIRGKHGTVHEPTGGGASLIVGVFVVAFGCFWTIMAASHSSPIAIFGLFFIGFAIFNIRAGMQKASGLAKARQKWERERSQLQRQIQEAGG